MTKQEFLDKLKASLLETGLSEEVCDQRCEAISRGFSKLSEDEARQYFTDANVRLIVRRLTGGSNPPEAKPNPAGKPAEPARPRPPRGEAEKPGSAPSEGKKPADASGSSGSPAPAPTIVIPKSDTKSGGKNAGRQDSDIAKVSGANDVIFVHRAAAGDAAGKHGLFGGFDDSLMSQSSPHPKLLLAAIIVLCAPMVLFLVLAVLGLSLGVALVMASVILGVVCVIAAIVCGGSILAVLSLIYGITQIISEPRYVGIHEIGLAMFFAGITILISVLLYNVAVRLIPLLYKLIGKGLRILIAKGRKLLSSVWKGCKSL